MVNKVKKVPVLVEDVVQSVNTFVKMNEKDLSKHYYSIIDKSSYPQTKASTSKIYQDIDEEEFSAELLNVSVVIITANYFESEILNYNSYLENDKSKVLRLNIGLDIFNENDNDFRLVKAYVFSLNGYRILHLHAPETGSNTPCGSADLVRYIYSNPLLKPTCIISFGICFGIDCNKQQIGETIVGQKIYPWSIGIKINERDWKIKHDDYIIDLRKSSKSLWYKIEEVINGTINNRSDKNFFKVSFGNIITGEAVVNNQKEKLKAIERAYGCDITAGEMEGYGLAKECIYYSHIPCLIIKAICDWGACKDINKYLDESFSNIIRNTLKDQMQAYAAYYAFVFLRKLFYEEVFSKDCTMLSIKKMLYENYYRDVVLQKDKLVEIINEYFHETLKLKNNIFSFKTITENTISNLLSLEVFDKREYEGIENYIFN